jgi:hypothetical protein
MNRRRYEGYIAARDALADQALDSFAAGIVGDLAESLLLARDKAEAEEVRQHVTEALGVLVDRGDLTPQTASCFWTHLRACGPQMHWPASWDLAHVTSRSAVRGD